MESYLHTALIHLNMVIVYFSQIKVDCISVNTTPVKAVIDDHIQRLFDALMNTLRKAITKEVGVIEGFLNTSMETLSKRPQTVEEIGEANGKHQEFGKKRKEVIYKPDPNKYFLIPNNSKGNNNYKINELYSLFLKFLAVGLLQDIRNNFHKEVTSMMTIWFMMTAHCH